MIFFAFLCAEKERFSFVKPEKDEEKQNRRDSVQAKSADFDWFLTFSDRTNGRNRKHLFDFSLLKRFTSSSIYAKLKKD